MASELESSADGITFQHAHTNNITYYTTTPSPSTSPQPGPGLIFVFVHDWAGSATEYKPLLALLAERRPHDRFVAISTPPDGVRNTLDRNARPATSISGVAEAAVHVCFELAGRTIYDYFGIPPAFVFVGHGHGCRIALEMIRENASCVNALRVVGLVMIDGASHAAGPKIALLERWDKQRAADGPGDMSALGKANWTKTKEPRRTMMLNIVETVKRTTPNEFLVNYLRSVSSVAEPFATDSLRRLGIWDIEEFPQLARNVARGEYGTELEVRVLGSAETDYQKATRLRSNETNAFQDYWLGTFCLYGQSKRCETVTFQDLSHWAHVDDPEAVADALVPFARRLLADEPVDHNALLEVTTPADIENAKLVVAIRDGNRLKGTRNVKPGMDSKTGKDVDQRGVNGEEKEVKHSSPTAEEADVNQGVDGGLTADVEADVKSYAPSASDVSTDEIAKSEDGHVEADVKGYAPSASDVSTDKNAKPEDTHADGQEGDAEQDVEA